MSKPACPFRVGDDAFVVDNVDGKYMLCKGVIDAIDFHAGCHAHVVWQDPPRPASHRHVMALSTTPVLAIISRRDLPSEIIQAVTDDAKARGLLAV